MFTILLSGNSAATSGLHAASTRPFAMAMTSAPPNSVEKPVAKMIVSDPTRCPTNDMRSSARMPIESARGANTSCDTAKPHSAAPPIHPTSSLVSTNSRLSESMMAPTVANATEVAMSATQLPRNRRDGLTFESVISITYSSPRCRRTSGGGESHCAIGTLPMYSRSVMPSVLVQNAVDVR